MHTTSLTDCPLFRLVFRTCQLVMAQKRHEKITLKMLEEYVPDEDDLKDESKLRRVR